MSDLQKWTRRKFAQLIALFLYFSRIYTQLIYFNLNYKIYLSLLNQINHNLSITLKFQHFKISEKENISESS